jgi:hypothetical protein
MIHGCANVEIIFGIFTSINLANILPKLSCSTVVRVSLMVITLQGLKCLAVKISGWAQYLSLSCEVAKINPQDHFTSRSGRVRDKCENLRPS